MLKSAQGLKGESNLSNEIQFTDMAASGATVVITHRVRDGMHSQYEAWLNEIGPICRSYPGLLDWQTIRPIPDLTLTNTVIIRFDTHDHLQNWLFSADRKRLIEKVLPLLSGDDDFFVRSGLDFWFAPEGAKAKLPVRWKQFLITWSAIYPLVLLMPLIVVPLLQVAGLPQNHYLATLCVTGLVVFNMVYVVMPRYTKLVHRWLFK